jgi:PadR family transcriptional regulator PadR
VLASPGRSSTPLPQRPERNLLIAWLLLLLDCEACHGYALKNKLEARQVNPDPAAPYRALRRLEGEGRVSSRWAQPECGPPRRLYRLTAAGRRSLNDLAAMIRLGRDEHDVFLDAREKRRHRSQDILAGDDAAQDAADGQR